MRPGRRAALAMGALALAAAATTAARPALARPRRPSLRHITTPADAAQTPAVRYGALTADACLAELERRGAEFAVVDPATTPGVLAPVRLAAPLRGVEYRTDLPAARRATSPYELMDCRLALALDDLGALLARHDVVAVRHYSAYRPPGKRWPAGKLGGQHAGALALDAARFERGHGAALDVLDDFHGRIGDATCGARAAPRRPTPATIALRALLCEVVEARLFHVVLTPNYNRPHRNHFHLEVMAGARWFLVH